MSRPSSAKNFKALQDKWYGKLKNSGFDDLEQADGNLKRSAGFDLPVRNSLTPNRIEARTQYYRLAGHFLHDHKFLSSSDRQIWKHHAEGMTVRSISETLRKHSINISKSEVSRVVQRLAKLMIKKARGEI